MSIALSAVPPVSSEVPFWWLRDAHRLLAVDVEWLPAVLDRLLAAKQKREVPADATVGRDLFLAVFSAAPVDDATTSLLYDRLCDNHGTVDMVEALAALTFVCGGALDAKARVLFTMFDYDRTRSLCEDDLAAMLETVCDALDRLGIIPFVSQDDIDDMVFDAFSDDGGAPLAGLDLPTFTTWLKTSPLCQPVYDIYRTFAVLQSTFDDVDKALDWLELQLLKRSDGGPPLALEAAAGRTEDQDGVRRAHTSTLTRSVAVESNPRVAVLCGPVVGKVGIDGAVVMLEVDVAAVVTAYAVPAAKLASLSEREAGIAPEVSTVAAAADTALLPAKQPRLFRFMGLAPGEEYVVLFGGLQPSDVETSVATFVTPKQTGNSKLPMFSSRVMSGLGCSPGGGATPAHFDLPDAVKAAPVACLHVGGQVDLREVARECVELLYEALLTPKFLGSTTAFQRVRRLARDRIADAYRSAWTQPAVRGFLSRGSHLMVGGHTDLPQMAHLVIPSVGLESPGHARTTRAKAAWKRRQPTLFNLSFLGVNLPGVDPEPGEEEGEADARSWTDDLGPEFVDQYVEEPLTARTADPPAALPTPAVSPPHTAEAADTPAPVPGAGVGTTPPSTAAGDVAANTATPPPVGDVAANTATPPPPAGDFAAAALGGDGGSLPPSPRGETPTQDAPPSPPTRPHSPSTDSSGSGGGGVLETLCLPFGFGVLMRARRQRRERAAAAAEASRRAAAATAQLSPKPTVSFAFFGDADRRKELDADAAAAQAAKDALGPVGFPLSYKSVYGKTAPVVAHMPSVAPHTPGPPLGVHEDDVALWQRARDAVAKLCHQKYSAYQRQLWDLPADATSVPSAKLAASFAECYKELGLSHLNLDDDSDGETPVRTPVPSKPLGRQPSAGVVVANPEDALPTDTVSARRRQSIVDRTRLSLENTGVLVFGCGTSYVAALDMAALPDAVESLCDWIRDVDAGVLTVATPLSLLDQASVRAAPQASTAIIDALMDWRSKQPGSRSVQLVCGPCGDAATAQGVSAVLSPVASAGDPPPGGTKAHPATVPEADVAARVLVVGTPWGALPPLGALTPAEVAAASLLPPPLPVVEDGATYDDGASEESESVAGSVAPAPDDGLPPLAALRGPLVYMPHAMRAKETLEPVAERVAEAAPPGTDALFVVRGVSVANARHVGVVQSFAVAVPGAGPEGRPGVGWAARPLLAPAARVLPAVTLGPVIGRVTPTQAVVLGEVDADARVRCVLTDILSARRHVVEAVVAANTPHAFVFTGLAPGRRHRVSFDGVNPRPRRRGVVRTPPAEPCAVTFVGVYGNAHTPDSTLPVFEAEGDPGDFEEVDVGGKRWFWEVPSGSRFMGPLEGRLDTNVWSRLWERVQRPWAGYDVLVHLGGQVWLPDALTRAAMLVDRHGREAAEASYHRAVARTAAVGACFDGGTAPPHGSEFVGGLCLPYPLPSDDVEPGAPPPPTSFGATGLDGGLAHLPPVAVRPALDDGSGDDGNATDGDDDNPYFEADAAMFESVPAAPLPAPPSPTPDAAFAALYTQLVDMLREEYRTAWNLPFTREVMAHVSNVCLAAPPDVTPSADLSPVVLAAARQVWGEYQQQLWLPGGGHAVEDVVVGVEDVVAGVPSPQFSPCHHFHRYGTVGLACLDGVGNRVTPAGSVAPHRALFSDAQLDALRAWAASGGMGAMVVASPAPLLGGAREGAPPCPSVHALLRIVLEWQQGGPGRSVQLAPACVGARPTYTYGVTLGDDDAPWHGTVAVRSRAALRQCGVVRAVASNGWSSVQASLLTVEAGASIVVGPVIGKVTPTAAIVLLEVDVRSRVRCVATDAFTGARVSVLRELGANQPYAYQLNALTPNARYFVSFEGVDNGLDRVGSFVTPPAGGLSGANRVLCLGRDAPPRLTPHAFPTHRQLQDAAAAAAAAAVSAGAVAGGGADDGDGEGNVGTLLVTVVRGENLADRDTLKKQDPYVKLGVKYCPAAAAETKAIKRGGVNPEWKSQHNPSHALPYVLPPGKPLLLRVSVFDWDKVGDDDLIGRGAVDVTPALVAGAWTDREVAVPLVDDNDVDAGVLHIKVSTQAGTTTAGLGHAVAGVEHTPSSAARSAAAAGAGTALSGEDKPPSPAAKLRMAASRVGGASKLGGEATVPGRAVGVDGDVLEEDAGGGDVGDPAVYDDVWREVWEQVRPLRRGADVVLHLGGQVDALASLPDDVLRDVRRRETQSAGSSGGDPSGGTSGVPLLSGMGLGVGLGLDDGLVHMNDDAPGRRGRVPHHQDFLPSRFAEEVDAGAGDGLPPLDLDALWDLHERLRQAYVFGWSMSLTRRVLANASHVMVGSGGDLGLDDQVSTASVWGDHPAADPSPAVLGSVAVTRLCRHLYSAYQRQLCDPMAEDAGDIDDGDDTDSSDSSGESVSEGEEEEGEEEEEEKALPGAPESKAAAEDTEPTATPWEPSPFEAVGSWSQGDPDMFLIRRGGIGYVVLGALTGWVQSGSGVQAVVDAEAAAGDTVAAPRGRRSSWFWFEDIGGGGPPPAAAPASPSHPPGRRQSLALTGAIQELRSQAVELPFKALSAAQAARLQEWLDVGDLDAMVVASPLPLTGGEGEDSIVSEGARAVLAAVFGWLDAAPHRRAAFACGGSRSALDAAALLHVKSGVSARRQAPCVMVGHVSLQASHTAGPEATLLRAANGAAAPGAVYNPAAPPRMAVVPSSSTPHVTESVRRVYRRAVFADFHLAVERGVADVAMCVRSAALQPHLTLGPLVGRVTPHSAVVLVEVDARARLALTLQDVFTLERFRRDVDCVPNVPAACVFDGLRPDRRYAVLVAGAANPHTLWLEAPPPAAWVTTPPAQPRAVTVAAVSDTAPYTDSHTPGDNALHLLAGQVKAPFSGVDVVLHVGGQPPPTASTLRDATLWCNVLSASQRWLAMATAAAAGDSAVPAPEPSTCVSHVAAPTRPYVGPVSGAPRPRRGSVVKQLSGVVSGFVTITAVRGYDLKDMDTWSKQDPYVVMALEGQSGAVARTQAVTRGGTDVTWTVDHSPTHTLRYMTAAGGSLVAAFEVFDKDVIGADDFIGRAALDLSLFVGVEASKERFTLDLHDDGGLPSGFLTVDVSTVVNLEEAELQVALTHRSDVGGDDGVKEYPWHGLPTDTWGVYLEGDGWGDGAVSTSWAATTAPCGATPASVPDGGAAGAGLAALPVVALVLRSLMSGWAADGGDGTAHASEPSALAHIVAEGEGVGALAWAAASRAAAGIEADAVPDSGAGWSLGGHAVDQTTLEWDPRGRTLAATSPYLAAVDVSVGVGRGKGTGMRNSLGLWGGCGMGVFTDGTARVVLGVPLSPRVVQREVWALVAHRYVRAWNRPAMRDILANASNIVRPLDAGALHGDVTWQVATGGVPLPPSPPLDTPAADSVADPPPTAPPAPFLLGAFARRAAALYENRTWSLVDVPDVEEPPLDAATVKPYVPLPKRGRSTERRRHGGRRRRAGSAVVEEISGRLRKGSVWFGGRGVVAPTQAEDGGGGGDAPAAAEESKADADDGDDPAVAAARAAAAAAMDMGDTTDVAVVGAGALRRARASTASSDDDSVVEREVEHRNQVRGRMRSSSPPCNLRWEREGDRVTVEPGSHHRPATPPPRSAAGDLRDWLHEFNVAADKAAVRGGRPHTSPSARPVTATVTAGVPPPETAVLPPPPPPAADHGTGYLPPTAALVGTRKGRHAATLYKSVGWGWDGEGGGGVPPPSRHVVPLACALPAWSPPQGVWEGTQLAAEATRWTRTAVDGAVFDHECNHCTLQLMRLGAVGLLFLRPRVDKWVSLSPAERAAAAARPLITPSELAALHVLLQTKGILGLVLATDAPLVLEEWRLGWKPPPPEKISAMIMAVQREAAARAARLRGDAAALKATEKRREERRKAREAEEAEDSLEEDSSLGEGEEDAVPDPRVPIPVADAGVRACREWRRGEAEQALWSCLVLELVQWCAQGFRYSTPPKPNQLTQAPAVALRALAVVSGGTRCTVMTDARDKQSPLRFQQVCVGPTTGTPSLYALPEAGVAGRLAFKHTPSVRFVTRPAVAGDTDPPRDAFGTNAYAVVTVALDEVPLPDVACVPPVKVDPQMRATAAAVVYSTAAPPPPQAPSLHVPRWWLRLRPDAGKPWPPAVAAHLTKFLAAVGALLASRAAARAMERNYHKHAVHDQPAHVDGPNLGMCGAPGGGVDASDLDTVRDVAPPAAAAPGVVPLGMYGGLRRDPVKGGRESVMPAGGGGGGGDAPPTAATREFRCGERSAVVELEADLGMSAGMPAAMEAQAVGVREAVLEQLRQLNEVVALRREADVGFRQGSLAAQAAARPDVVDAWRRVHACVAETAKDVFGLHFAALMPDVEDVFVWEFLTARVPLTTAATSTVQRFVAWLKEVLAEAATMKFAVADDVALGDTPLVQDFDSGVFHDMPSLVVPAAPHEALPRTVPFTWGHPHSHLRARHTDVAAALQADMHDVVARMDAASRWREAKRLDVVAVEAADRAAAYEAEVAAKAAAKAAARAKKARKGRGKKAAAAEASANAATARETAFAAARQQLNADNAASKTAKAGDAMGMVEHEADVTPDVDVGIAGRRRWERGLCPRPTEGRLIPFAVAPFFDDAGDEVHAGYADPEYAVWGDPVDDKRWLLGRNRRQAVRLDATATRDAQVAAFADTNADDWEALRSSLRKQVKDHLELLEASAKAAKKSPKKRRGRRGTHAASVEDGAGDVDDGQSEASGMRRSGSRSRFGGASVVSGSRFGGSQVSGLSGMSGGSRARKGQVLTPDQIKGEAFGALVRMAMATATTRDLMLARRVTQRTANGDAATAALHAVWRTQWFVPGVGDGRRRDSLEVTPPSDDEEPRPKTKTKKKTAVAKKRGGGRGRGRGGMGRRGGRGRSRGRGGRSRSRGAPSKSRSPSKKRAPSKGKKRAPSKGKKGKGKKEGGEGAPLPPAAAAAPAGTEETKADEAPASKGKPRGRSKSPTKKKKGGGKKGKK